MKTFKEYRMETEASNTIYKVKKGGKVVKSVANRLVKFDSNLEHTGYTSTNKKRRVVINFNYE